VQYGEEMCRSLQKQGAVCLHFYTLNLEKVTVGILRTLRLATSYDAAAEAAAIAPPATENAAQMLDMIKSGEVLKAGAADTNGAAAGACVQCAVVCY
jgi:Methylenetetrahydrofolate reductase